MKTLGIDLGTGKVACVILDSQKGLIQAVSCAHDAALPRQEDPGIFEQDAEKILFCVKKLLHSLEETHRRDIAAVGITGQMHSILLKEGNKLSPLVTWQDHRCGEDLIRKFNETAHLDLHEGFGGTTLARLASEGKLFSSMQCGSISDFLASEMTGHHQLFTDPTHAASFGLYDLANNCWNRMAVESLKIPYSILPPIRPSGTVLGLISPSWSREFSLPEGTLICNPLGDNQASVLGTGSDPAEEIYLTLGTGAQLSAVTNTIPESLSPGIEVRPFPGGRYLLVKAPLCGGAAFAFLADTVNSFRTALGEEASDRKHLMDQLDELGMEYLRKHGESSITIHPHFLGERLDPALRGAVHGLTLDNASPGALVSALAFGIVRNLKKDFPPEILANRKKICASGNGVRQVKTIQYAIQKEFALELQLSETAEEAACGAAISAARSVRASE